MANLGAIPRRRPPLRQAEPPQEEEPPKDKEIHVALWGRWPLNIRHSERGKSTLKFDTQARRADIKGEATFTFSQAFGVRTPQIDMVHGLMDHHWRNLLFGYSSTLFVFGNSELGRKSFMDGQTPFEERLSDWEQDPTPGLIPFMLTQIFEKLAEKYSKFSVKVSYMQIYDEEVFDLLNPSLDEMESLQVLEDPCRKDGVIIEGLTEITVPNKAEAYKTWMKAAERRDTAAALKNQDLSRSYTIFSMTLYMCKRTANGLEKIRTVKLNLVDLPGSENLDFVDFREATLADVLRVMYTLKGGLQLQFEDSKVTRILKDLLGGPAMISMLFMVSAADVDILETRQTINFADKVQPIGIEAKKNHQLSKAAYIEENAQQIQWIQRKVQEEWNILDGLPEDHPLQHSLRERITSCTRKMEGLERDLKTVIEELADSAGEGPSSEFSAPQEFYIRVLQEDWNKKEEERLMLVRKVAHRDAQLRQKQELLRRSEDEKSILRRELAIMSVDFSECKETLEDSLSRKARMQQEFDAIYRQAEQNELEARQAADALKQRALEYQKTIEEKDAEIKRQQLYIQDLTKTIEEKDAEINKLRATITEQQVRISELEDLVKTTAEKEAEINKLRATITEQQVRISELEDLVKTTAEKDAEIKRQQVNIQDLVKTNAEQKSRIRELEDLVKALRISAEAAQAQDSGAAAGDGDGAVAGAVAGAIAVKKEEENA